MTNEQFQQLMLVLGQIGNTAYQAALQQVYVNGNLDLFWGIGCIVLFLVGLVALIWGIHGVQVAEKDKTSWWSRESGDGFQVFLCIGGGGLALFGLVSAGINFSDAYTALASPQWQAIQMMAKLVIK